jgi:hypothetical protein
MRIFISHSGERSQLLAEHVALFVKQIIQATDPWISTGMDKGLKWLPEIAAKLDASGLGIVCLTKENLTRPWILFEAGALAKHLNDKVCTLLLDVESKDVGLPLEQFQDTKADDKEEVWKLVATIVKEVRAAGSSPPPDADLRKMFDEYHWPRFSAQVDALRKKGAAIKPPTRSVEDMFTEVVTTVRGLAQTVVVLYNRQDKALLLAKQQYEEVVGKEAPTLQALRNAVAHAEASRDILTSLGARREILLALLNRLGSEDERPLSDFGKIPPPEEPSDHEDGAPKPKKDS